MLARFQVCVELILKPKLALVIHPSNRGAGIPNGGLFSAMELERHAGSPSRLDIRPETQ